MEPNLNKGYYVDIDTQKHIQLPIYIKSEYENTILCQFYPASY